MDPDEAPMSRTAAFGQGAGTASLAQDSARLNAQVPRMFTPQSVLHQLYLSPQNGRSAKDADRVLIGGGSLPTGNAMSAETNQASRLIVSKYANV